MLSDRNFQRGRLDRLAPEDNSILLMLSCRFGVDARVLTNVKARPTSRNAHLPQRATETGEEIITTYNSDLRRV